MHEQVAGPNEQVVGPNEQVVGPNEPAVNLERQAVRVEGRVFEVTHLDRVLWPAAGWTKADLIHYLMQVAPVMLPHLRERPLTVVRCPDGVEGQCFYQKNRPPHLPDWIPTHRSDEGPDGTEYVLAHEPATLVWLANQNAVEFHPWLAPCTAPDFPAATVIDIDPMPPTGFAEARQVAFWVKELLDALGLFSVPKLSGASGVHIYVPLDGRTPFARSRDFARWVAAAIAHLYPEHATDIRSVKERGPRVYVDPLQNLPHKTIAAPYSPRALPHGAVSMPVTWDELARVETAAFTLKSAPERVRQRGDPFRPVLEVRQSIPDPARLPRPERV